MFTVSCRLITGTDCTHSGCDQHARIEKRLDNAAHT